MRDILNESSRRAVIALMRLGERFSGKLHADGNASTRSALIYLCLSKYTSLSSLFPSLFFFLTSKILPRKLVARKSRSPDPFFTLASPSCLSIPNNLTIPHNRDALSFIYISAINNENERQLISLIRDPNLLFLNVRICIRHRHRRHRAT